MTPELRGTHAYPRLICASHPEALARIRRERELLFRELPRIDHLFFPSGDSAGCSCPSCHPWVQTYLPGAAKSRPPCCGATTPGRRCG